MVAALLASDPSAWPERNAFFRKGIILAAGAYGSPQILMLSGIGPADELNSFGIPVVVDLPVERTCRTIAAADELPDRREIPLRRRIT